ncbi:hypothetical protein BDV25DRAFT_154893 [Aspergillus avenaceus]|uniref:Uncharacterized protein n=1 Tax=Aspergillus avenaceus TaxID=36643 RepID=A0A5N6TVQ2_ASPAV|nr:hypothetical protein BDV25DRAFT_154893 [Aspergillus avenaceus]
MLHSVIGIPSIVSPPPPNHWSIFENDQYYKDQQYRQRQGDNENTGDYPSGSKSDPSTDANDTTRSRSRWPGSEDPWQGYRGRRQGPPRDPADFDFFDSFLDRFWLDDHISSRFFHPYNRPMFSGMLSDNSPTWSVPYLMFSPYSPLHLERQAQYRASREKGIMSSLLSTLNISSEHDPAEPQWREAFEDLLRLENGKPMLDRDPADIGKREPGKDWLQGLVKRGSLGDRFKYISGSEGGQPWSVIAIEDKDRRSEGETATSTNTKSEFDWNSVFAGPEPVTELDLYDRFLADIDAREREFRGTHGSPVLRRLLEETPRPESNAGRTQDAEWKSTSETETYSENVTESSKPAAEQPWVKKSENSIHRVRLPDGSVQTKTIQTKWYSDGREERNEYVDVANPPQANQQSTQEGSTDQSKDGWFWKGDKK